MFLLLIQELLAQVGCRFAAVKRHHLNVGRAGDARSSAVYSARPQVTTTGARCRPWKEAFNAATSPLLLVALADKGNQGAGADVPFPAHLDARCSLYKEAELTKSMLTAFVHRAAKVFPVEKPTAGLVFAVHSGRAPRPGK